ncbi:hypothetical protein B0A55_00489 [Friedmanniomyces simplex]|uniref:Heterokaryon incompatibility domain-containing protein n=1 Tax=Friedmanniomyces simplex TaxID=329884 RepID=A0A4U0XZN3_9PEZI|nr:hypothetical protein B0A55_00489 [Friedmanniomyces simplex]
MASSGRGESQPKRGRYQLAAKEFTVHYAEGRKYRAVWDDRYNPSIHGDEASPQQEFEIALRYQNPQAENGAQFPAATPEPDPQVAKFLRDKRQTANRHGDPHEIRVFELLPSPSDSDDVVGKLHAVSVGFKYERRRPTRHGVSLTEGLPVCYTALSYVWGTSCCNSTITIDGQAKHITDALLVALQHLRHPTISVMLWIDQICIDQEDMKDKESQIKLMGAIYQRAWNTVIWLGPEQDRGACRALHGMYEVMRYVEGDLLEEQLQHFRYTSPEQREEYDSLMALLKNPWFKPP